MRDQIEPRLIAALLVSLILAGCGGPQKLTSHEAFKVSSYELDFADTVLDGSHYSGTLRGVDYLIALCRKDPGAVYPGSGKEPDRTMRQVVEDGANTLQEYRPALAAQLDRVARNGCK